MLNLSELLRQRKESFEQLAVGYLEPEIYIAESIADYRSIRDILSPPWFKFHPFSAAKFYAFVIFYNVGIDAIIEDGKLVDNFVKVHDDTGFSAMVWNDEDSIFPAEKSYSQMLEEHNLEQNDWAYRLIIRHSYEGKIPFILDVAKFRHIKLKEKRTSRLERMVELLPQPAYSPA